MSILGQLTPLLQHRAIPMTTKKHLIQSIFIPTLCYQCQTWSHFLNPHLDVFISASLLVNNATKLGVRIFFFKWCSSQENFMPLLSVAFILIILEVQSLSLNPSSLIVKFRLFTHFCQCYVPLFRTQCMN
jgi:hypothetical protein